MIQSTTPTDRSRILDFLRQVDRRLRLNDGLFYLTKGLWGLIALLVLLKLTGFWERPGARFALLAVYGVGLVGYLGYRFVSGRGLSRTAVIADRRAALHDTLTSAHAFLGSGDRTKWMDFQIGRAAESTEKLTAAQIAPTNSPGQFLPALGVGVALFALLSWNPTWLREIDAPSLLSWARDGEPETMEDLLDEAEALPEEQAKLAELEEAVESLKRRDLELAEILGDLEIAQEALAASQVDMERLEMDFEQIAANLEASATLSELSEALKAHDAEEVAELLRELAERLSEAQSSEELQALLEALSNANLQQADLAEMMESLESAGGEMSDQSLAEMAQALRDAADQLEQMGQQMASQQSMDPGQEMATLESSLAQEQSSSQRQGASQQEGSQATQSAAGMMSDQMQMAQMQGDPSNAVPVDAGPAGDATGPGGSGSEVLGEATSLEVQLEMELLEKEARDEPVPEDIFERLSREEKSTLNYQTIQQRGSYAEENALTREHVPWQYRSLVKRYFMSIIANSKTKAEPSQEK